MENYAIEMLNVTKRFSRKAANDNITLQLRKGEIHALLGENGAGKSTLMSILFGLYEADEGIIKKDGEVIQINGPKDATKYKIGMVHQHFKLVEVFTALENIILGVEPTKNGFLEKSKAIASEIYGLIASSLVYKLKNNEDINVIKLYREYENTVIEGLKMK